MRTRWTLLGNLLGLGLLGWLVARTSPGLLWAQLQAAGLWVLIPYLAYLPAALARTFALQALLPRPIPMRRLFPIQLVSESLSRIIPLAGLGGEPYRHGRLKQWLESGEATRAIVHDRLVHLQAALLFTGLSVLAMLSTVTVGDRIYRFSLPFAALCLLAGVALAAPYLGRLRLVPRRWARSLLWKQLALALTLLELAGLFWVLDLPLTWPGLFTVAAMIEISTVLFVFVPSGVGVNEAGISLAFTLIGLSPELGVAYGLLRRGRIVLGSILGVLWWIYQRPARSA